MSNQSIVILNILFWAVVVGYCAKKKGRNPVIWGLAGGVIPFLPLLALYRLKGPAPAGETTVQPRDAANDAS